jgi:hypothetical protein
MIKNKRIKLIDIKKIRFAVEIEVEFAHSKDSQKLIDRHRVLDGWEIDYDGCFDEQTLILTDSGWKYFKDLNEFKDLVLSMNPVTGQANYYPIIKFYKKEYNRSMFELNEKTCSFSLSPNHFVYGKYHKNNSYGYLRISDIYNRSKQNSQLRIPRIFTWSGIWKPYKKIIIEGDLYKNHPYHKLSLKKHKKYEISLKTWVKFLGLYLSEGYVGKNTVVITQSVASKYNNHIRQVIKALPFSSSIYRKKATRPNEHDCFQYCINNTILVDYLRQYGTHCYNKFIPEYMRFLTPIYIQMFLDYYCFGDGHLKVQNKEWSISTTSSKMALGLHELILKLGKYASIKHRKIIKKNTHDSYVINIYSSTESHLILTKNITAIENLGKYIYCIETAPYNLIYVMRNGTSYWSRNSLDNGAEYRPKNSNHLYFTEEGLTQLKEILALIKVHRGRVSKNCGLHIHINCRNFSDKQVLFIIREFIACQRYIVKTFNVHPDRLAETCKLLPRENLNKLTEKQIKDFRKQQNKWTYIGYNALIEEKYNALNIGHLREGDYGTLEFRLFDSTLSYKRLKSQIEWTLNFIKRSVERE